MADNLPTFIPDEESVKRRRVMKIIVAVVIVHFLSLSIPLLWDLISNWLKPKEQVITLNIDGLLGDKDSGGGANPLARNQDGTPPPPILGEPPPPSPKQPKKPEPPTPEPPSPEPPTPTPPTPNPPRPTPPQPTLRPAVKPKPRPKALSATEITVSKKTIKRSKKTKNTAASTPHLNTAALDKALHQAMQVGQPGGVKEGGVADGITGGKKNGNLYGGQKGPPGPLGNGIGPITVTYGSKLGAYIRPRWDQPSKYDLNNRSPQVTIFLQIAPNGFVMSSGIVTPSGVPAMDRSVQKMLANLKTVPTPPPGLDTNHFELILAIED